MSTSKVRKLAKKLDSAILGEREDVARISTGCEVFDIMLEGGIPEGRVTEIVGDFSTGKSLIGLQLCRENIATGGFSIYIDSENSLHPTWVEKLGVDPNELIVADPTETDTLENTYDYIRKVLVLAKSIDEPFLIVWDSVAASIPAKQKTGEGSMMAIDARIHSVELRTLLEPMSENQTTLVMINQLREKPGVMFGQKWDSFGGKAIRFYSSMRLFITKKGKIKTKNKTQTIGIIGRMEVLKSKVSRPHRWTDFELIHGKGIDKMSGMELALKRAKIDEKNVVMETLSEHTIEQLRESM